MEARFDGGTAATPCPACVRVHLPGAGRRTTRPLPAPPRPQRDRRAHRLQRRPMNSLRFRLVIGSALVAVVPLALVMVVLSQRIERMVRDQAAERVNGVLNGLAVRLGEDWAQTRKKVAI